MHKITTRLKAKSLSFTIASLTKTCVEKNHDFEASKVAASQIKLEFDSRLAKNGEKLRNVHLRYAFCS